MKASEWPESILDRNGDAYGRLCDGTRLTVTDVFAHAREETPADWSPTRTGKPGEVIGEGAETRDVLIYYRKLTDPLTIAMARALAAKQPDKSTG